MNKPEPVRVLAEGTLKYLGSRQGNANVDWMTARVFVLDYAPSWGGGDPYVTVVAREPMYLPYHRVPSLAGTIHSMRAYDESDGDYQGEGDLLMLDLEELVPS